VERVVFSALVKKCAFKSIAVRLWSNGLIKLINLTPINGKGLDLISDCFWCVQAQPFGQINGNSINSDSRGIQSTQPTRPGFALGERPFSQPMDQESDAEAFTTDQE